MSWIMNCTSVCPKGLNPSKAINEIKRVKKNRIVSKSIEERIKKALNMVLTSVT